MGIANKVNDTTKVFSAMMVLALLGLITLIVFGNLSGNLGFTANTQGYNDTEGCTRGIRHQPERRQRARTPPCHLVDEPRIQRGHALSRSLRRVGQEHWRHDRFPSARDRGAAARYWF